MKKKLFLVLACILIPVIATPVLASSTIDNYILIEGVKYQSGDELIGLRDQYSQTFVTSEGFSRRISLGSIHYEASPGNFYAIDTTIVPSSKPNWDWEVTTGHWQLFVKNDATVAVKKDSNWIGTRLHGIAYLDIVTKDYTILQTTNPVVPIVNENTIRWNNILYGVDLVLHYTNDSFKEDIIVKQEARDFLNSPGHRPSDYGYSAQDTYLVPIFECDWSQSLPMRLRYETLDLELAVNPDEAEHEEIIYFKSPTKDRYFDTNLVSFLPLDYAVSENIDYTTPINPEDPEEEWRYTYASEKIRKRLIKKNDKHWLLMGVPVTKLNQMPAGSIIFDPTETLRPNAAGDETNIPSQYPASGSHWEKVDEVVADDADYVFDSSGSGDYHRDLYNLPDSGIGAGSISKIKVYFRVKETSAGCYARPALKSNSTVTDGTDIDLTSAWVTYSQEWANNPADSEAWEWTDIDALQIGISLADACFTGDTLITMADGSYREAKNIHPGDRVAYYDFIERKVKSTTVTKVNEHPADETGPYYLVLNNKLKATPNHPLDKPDGTIITVGEVKVGDFVQGETESIKIFSVEKVWERVKTYSLETESGRYFIDGFSDIRKPLSAYCSQLYVEVNYVAAPSITTNEASNIASTSARLNSTVIDDGDQSCDVRFGYGQASQTSGNFTLYDTVTAWQLDQWDTGEHPYYDASSLNASDTYYYRAQIRNDTDNMTGDEVSFVTSSPTLGTPSSFKAYPSETSISLTWGKGASCSETLIRHKPGSFPTSTADGNLLYSGTAITATHTGLTTGTTIFYSAWGVEGSNNSTSYATIAMTTLATSADGDVATTPTAPSGWFQAPDYTNMSNFEPIYSVFNTMADTLSIPKATFWLFATIMFCMATAIGTLAISKGNMIAGVGVLCLTMVLGVSMELLPSWMIGLIIIFGLGGFQLAKGER